MSRRKQRKTGDGESTGHGRDAAAAYSQLSSGERQRGTTATENAALQLTKAKMAFIAACASRLTRQADIRESIERDRGGST